MSRQLDIPTRRLAVTAAATAPFAVNYRQHTPAEALADMDEYTLGVISFGSDGRCDDARDLRIPLASLHPAGWVEIWNSSTPVEHGWQDGFGYAANGEVILAQLRVDESQFTGIEDAAYDAYTRMQAFLQSQDYPHPLRIWNYFSGINNGAEDEERYKHFSLGRARAIREAGGLDHDLPAASAIGCQDGDFFIFLLAAKDRGIQIENPRQVSAFHYPRQYGIQSPSFSRARLMHWQSGRHLYLSGTASVVGHETLHCNDCRAQLDETLRNIDSLLANTGNPHPQLPACEWDDLQLLRVYLRNRNDLPMARDMLESRLGSHAPVAYLHGDICRQDLLIEIEGIYCARP